MAYKRFSEEERKKYREQKIDDAAHRMNEYINDMKSTDKFKEFLNTTSKFHNYSMRNIVLIAQQKPDSTLVAGYNSWKNNFERQVQKGAQSIKIIAPVIKKKEHDKLDKEGKVERDNQGNPKKEIKPTIVGYRTHNVFDISETKGKEIITARDLIQDNLNSSNDYKDLYNEFKTTIGKNNNLQIEEKNSTEDSILSEGANGYFSPNKDLIVINKDESFDMKFRTLIHEYAHFKLEHGDNSLGLDTGTKELQAESCAYIVADYYNLDTSDYSIGYNATWTATEQDVLIQYLSDIKDFASNTIEEINSMPNFEQFITKEQSENLAKEEEKSLTKMIDINLKNGFDKVPIIQGNLVTDHNMSKNGNNFENDYFKVDFDYKGYDTKNIIDKCNVTVTNKTNDNNIDFNFKQTYNLNNLNNTSQVLVTDLKTDKTYFHERDYEGNVKGNDFKGLSDEDQLVYFDKYIDKNIEEKGILGTQVTLISDVHKMGFKLENDNESDRQEIKLLFKKNDDIDNKNPFKNQKEFMEINILTDSNNNHHASFKMENRKGIINKSAVESDDIFNENANRFNEKLTEKKQQMEI